MRHPHRACISRALAVSRNSEPERKDNPRVGAVLSLPNGKSYEAFRGEKVRSYIGSQSSGDHAEYTLLHKKLRSKSRLEGGVLYTTLEPCTHRNHGKMPCAQWVVEKGIKHVVIGLLDPNPHICGKGYWHLIENGVRVDFFPASSLKELIQINQPFIDVYRTRQPVDLMFSRVVQDFKDDRIRPYNAFGFGAVLELLASPHPRNGWALAEVRLEHSKRNRFVLPSPLKTEYQRYFRSKYAEERFVDDGEKFMLTRNPIAWEESPTLLLKTISAKYSEKCFFRDCVAPDLGKAKPLIDELLEGQSLRAEFANALNLQVIVVTHDAQILVTKRSRKTGVHRSLWSVSVEEDLHASDLKAGSLGAVLAWGQRLLREELKLAADAYHTEDLRLLSIFLESDLLNVSLCGYVQLKYTRAQLEDRLRERRGDIEFTDWRFVEASRESMLTEILKPTYHYHPTSRYRLLLAFLKSFGRPTDQELDRFRT